MCAICIWNFGSLMLCAFMRIFLNDGVNKKLNIPVSVCIQDDNNGIFQQALVLGEIILALTINI